MTLESTIFINDKIQSTIMKSLFRLFAGIILHPVRVIVMMSYRKRENQELLMNARDRTWHDNHERMHHMSFLTNTAYTKSSLYDNLYFGAPEL